MNISKNMEVIENSVYMGNVLLDIETVAEKAEATASFVVEALPIFKRYKVKGVLDLGCGVGRHCVYLAKNGFDVVGVDVSESAPRMAQEWTRKERLAKVSFVRATMLTSRSVISVSML
jgi:tRNA/tmRNA/rRNA uracil-C5-methylase (TrmA/RlmC/RlmD family)